MTDAQVKAAFSQFLHDVMNDRGLSLNGLARLTGESAARLHGYLHENKLASLAVAARIAAAVGESLDAIFVDEKKSLPAA